MVRCYLTIQSQSNCHGAVDCDSNYQILQINYIIDLIRIIVVFVHLAHHSAVFLLLCIHDEFVHSIYIDNAPLTNYTFKA